MVSCNQELVIVGRVQYIRKNPNLYPHQHFAVRYLVIVFASIICVFVIMVFVSPYVVIPTIFVGIISYILRRFYLKTSRSVKRLEGVTKSPVFSMLSSSLNGLTSIRAFKAEDMMMNEFDHHQDIHSSAFFASLG